MTDGRAVIAAIVDRVIGPAHFSFTLATRLLLRPSGRLSLTARRLLMCPG
jgi:hypothetical protein